MTGTSRPTARPRVLWVNHFAVTPDMGGGTRHIELGRELERRGWGVTIAASDFHAHHRRYMRRASGAEQGAIDEVVDGVDVKWLWAAEYAANDRRRVWNWLSFGRSVSGIALAGTRPDVVIGSSPQLFAALAAYRVARRLGVPFVLEVRDLWPESLAIGGRKRGVGYHGLDAVARFLYRAAARIIVLALGVKDYLVKRGVSADKIHWVPNGVDVAAFGGTQPATHDALRLVYAGAHGPANGLDTVLDAAHQLAADARVTFVMLGDGPAKESLRARARALGLERVTFVDPIAKSAMPEFLSRCDAGLMVLKDVPLFAFGVSPNKLFDYWGAALPVVANVPGEVADWVTSSAGGVRAADSSAPALAGAIRGLLAMSPAERRAMGVRGRAWVAREHDRPMLAARLDTILQGVLSGAR